MSSSANKVRDDLEPGGPDDSTKAGDLPNHIGLGRLLGNYLSEFFELVGLEGKLAAKSVISSLVVCLFLLPLGLFTWLAFALLLSWAVYELTAIALAGFAAFFVLHLLALVGCLLLLRIYKSRMTFKESRNQLNLVVGSVFNEIDNASKKEEQTS